jgi:plastocyanin
MMRKFVMTCAACAVAATAGTAGATGTEDETLNLGDALTERRVDIKGGVFFPPMILASTGETIYIRNEEDTVHDATAMDGSWTTGPIQPGAVVEVTVSAGMNLCFESSYNVEYKGAFGSAATGEAPACFELSGAGDGSETVQN